MGRHMLVGAHMTKRKSSKVGTNHDLDISICLDGLQSFALLSQSKTAIIVHESDIQRSEHAAQDLGCCFELSENYGQE